MPFLRWISCALIALSPALVYSQTPEVAPGLSLPTSMVSVVYKDSGQVKVQRMESAVVASDPHTGSNIAKGLVYANQHNSIQIAGKTSPNILHDPQPSFYVRLPDEHRDMFRDQWTLIRLKPAPEVRIAIEFTANAFGGSRKRKMDIVATDKADVNSGDWVKITPSKPLEPGEYGLVPVPNQPLSYSETIYDFTVAAQ